MFPTRALSLMVVVVSGCVSPHPWRNRAETDVSVSPAQVQIERGGANQLVDGTGWVLGIPSKVALWDRRADNHDVSTETEEQLVRYMKQNDLQSVLVRVNQYDPLGEWRRLVENKRIGAGWRYTVGTFDLLKYTLLPGRIMGGDWYNPFTDTINLYSDLPPLALAEAAYAKDVRGRPYPGTYAAVQGVPIVGMWHETIATRDVLDYVSSSGSVTEQREAERILYPDYGASWGGQVASFLPYGNILGRLAGAGVGHVANRVKTLTDRPNNEGQADRPHEQRDSSPTMGRVVQ